MNIPSWTYKFDLEKNRNEYIDCINEVFDSGRLLFGKQLENFEKSFSKYIGTKYSVGCDNGTNAIFLGLKALNIGKGDKVITVPNTAIPTVSAICQAGAKPVFVDVNDYALIDVNKIEEKIDSETKAIIPVHLYGFPCDMDSICSIAKKHKLHILEDCSQAHGTKFNNQKVGSFGNLSTFSFYPTKSLGSFGDAGMICTNCERLNELIRKLRFYGIQSDYVASMEGYNSRMDEIHAAILNKKLKRLENNIKYRNEVYKLYLEGFNSKLLEPIKPPLNSRPSHYLLPFIFKGDRDLFVQELNKKNIGVNISYKTPIHIMPGYKFLGYQYGEFKNAEYFCKHNISFPIFDNIPKSLVLEVIENVNAILLD
tara:strand:+ start:58 stop:1161 length:1104 start_codon:yes stop_codon:yes gene_type:complete